MHYIMCNKEEKVMSYHSDYLSSLYIWIMKTKLVFLCMVAMNCKGIHLQRLSYKQALEE